MVELITGTDANDISIVAGDKVTVGAKYYSVKVRLSAVYLKANKNEAASGSATFEGNGELTLNTVV